jgi:5-methylcytosine-specific restriction protein A
MKLSNFLNLDPNYPGKGLSAVSQLDREVWGEFSTDLPRLKSTAAAIRENFRAVNTATELYEDDIEEFREGKVLTRLHTFRERDRRVVKKKKDKVWMDKGKLACEACGFDFAKTYGEIGFKFAECHHTKPLHLLRPNDITRLSDLAIVCANCHRMLHRGLEVITIQQLSEMIRS